MRNYQLPAQFFGVEHMALLDHIVPATVLNLPGLASQPQIREVSLEPLPGGWRVRAGAGIIATFSPKEAAAFPALQRLRRAGMVPTTWAICEIVDQQIKIGIHVGPSEWLVPVNTVPTQAEILDGGQPAAVDTSRGDLPADFATHTPACQLVVRVDKHGPDLVASTEEHVLGPLSAPADFPALAAALDARPHHAVLARAYYANGCLAVDVPTDKNTPRFRPAPPPLPDAGAWPPRPQATPEIWDITVDSSAFLSPTPSARPISSPLPPAPEAPRNTFGPFPALYHAPPEQD